MKAPYLRCPRERLPTVGHRPFQELTGLRGRGKSLALQRALSDFGAERSFERASRQLREHYGVQLHRSSVREVVLKQAQRAGGFVEREEREAIASYEGQRSYRPGQPWLIVESDGSMVRTGKAGTRPGGWSESWGASQTGQEDPVAGSAAELGGDLGRRGTALRREL